MKPREIPKMAYKTLSIKKAGSGATINGFGISYHQQEKHDPEMYCGAAAAQMVLDSIGAGLIDQTELYTSFRPPTDNEDCDHKCCSADPIGTWYTAPDMLECILNKRKPESFSGSFKLWDLPSVDALSRKVCWAIEHHGVAPIVLATGGSHWIVVVGYEATAQPRCSTDTDYDIMRFEVFDPQPPTSAPAPPPLHGGPSDFCGMGFIHGFERGIQDNGIYYAKESSQFFHDQFWRNGVVDQVDIGRTWDGKYLVICDPDPPADTQDPPSVFDEVSLVLGPDMIWNLAEQWFDDRARREGYRQVPELDSLRAGIPLLVEREDLTQPLFYYIVPFATDGDIRMATYVNAYGSGGVAQVIAAPQGTTHLTYALNRDTVIQRFAGRNVEVGEHDVRLRAEDLHDNLVWRPCSESLSPFWPFYRFDADVPGVGRIPIYVRIDGALFTELHEGQGPDSGKVRARR